jgi:hypothetical protein
MQALARFILTPSKMIITPDMEVWKNRERKK